LKPSVSILIPAYNAERWIGETLRSAVSQTWECKEIIVVNDGSTDRTMEAIEPFLGDGVRVVTQPNQGAAAARNRAFAESQGDYIQWLDADDLLSPDKISSQMAVLDQSPGNRILLSSAWGKFLYRPHRASFVPTRLWCDLSPAEWMVRQMEQNVYMQTATWLVSREVTETAGPWDTRLLGDDDGEYFCRVLMASEGVRFVPEAKVYYRATGSSSLSYIGRSDRKMEAQWLSMQLHIRYVRSLDDSPRARAACVRYLQNWLISFYPERMDLVKEADAMAGQLGGQLSRPRLSWKYSWMEAAFGQEIAKRAQRLLPGLRWSFQRSLDKTLLRMETHMHIGGSNSR
jgi:glycosyltransferase involved in cell wall biosynthesis